MVHTVDGSGAARRNYHAADSNKDGKVTRQEAQEFREAKVAQAKPQGDVVQTQYPTVGEHIENTLIEAKNEFFESAKIAGVMAIPGVNVAAGVVYSRHMNEARKEIAQLPMDPEGKWKVEARAIVSRHHEMAEDEILALPGKVAQGAVDAVDAVVDETVETAQQVWGNITDSTSAMWEFAKTEVPRAAKELAQETAVLAIMANPLGAVPSAIIIKNHIAEANRRIMALPMDPEGNWKAEARSIIREEMEEAEDEIVALPGKAWQGVKDVSSAVYDGARDALVATGEAIANTGEAIVDGTVYAYTATVDTVSREFDEARKGLGGAISRFGRWISGD